MSTYKIRKSNDKHPSWELYVRDTAGRFYLYQLFGVWGSAMRSVTGQWPLPWPLP